MFEKMVTIQPFFLEVLITVAEWYSIVRRIVLSGVLKFVFVDFLVHW